MWPIFGRYDLPGTIIACITYSMAYVACVVVPMSERLYGMYYGSYGLCYGLFDLYDLIWPTRYMA